MPVEQGEGLKAILAGSSNLPLSASNKAQKPLPEGMGFDWKPSDRQTQRDIIQADYRDETIRRAVKEVNRPPRKPVVESKPVAPRVDIGNGLRELLTARTGSKIKQYDRDAKEMEGGEGWMDRQDAARHLLTIGNTARIAGRPVANVLATAYEWISGSANEDDAKMDEHNNKLALSLFNAKDYKEVKERVKKLMETSQYQDTSDPNKPVFYSGLDDTKN